MRVPNFFSKIFYFVHVKTRNKTVLYMQKREILYYMCRNVELPKTNPRPIVAREDTPAKPLTCKAFFFYLLHGKERRTVCLRTSSLRAQERPRDRSSHSSVAAWNSERGKQRQALPASHAALRPA